MVEVTGWLQLLVLVVSAVIAYFSYKKHTDLTRKRATLDLYLSFTKDNRTVKAFRILQESMKDGDFYNIVTSSDDSREKEAILLILNLYEFVSAGANAGILDDKLLKKLNFSDTERLWNFTKLGITKLRETTERETIFQEFETLALRWEKEPLKPINSK